MKQNKIKYSAVISLISLSFFVPLAGTQAQTTVLDNTGLAGSPGPFAAAYSSGGPEGTATTEMASGFTTGSSATVLDSITLDLNTGNSGSGFTLALYSDNGSLLPGTLLETLSGNDSPDSGGLVTYTSIGTALAANTTYWWVSSEAPSVDGGNFAVHLTDDSAGTSAQGWDFGSTYQDNATSGGMFGDTDSGWGNVGGTAQFSVDATIVPEPSALALSTMGGLGALILYRRLARLTAPSTQPTRR